MAAFSSFWLLSIQQSTKVIYFVYIAKNSLCPYTIWVNQRSHSLPGFISLGSISLIISQLSMILQTTLTPHCPFGSHCTSCPLILNTAVSIITCIICGILQRWHATYTMAPPPPYTKKVHLLFFLKPGINKNSFLQYQLQCFSGCAKMCVNGTLYCQEGHS